MQGFLILGGAFLISLLLSVFPFVRAWWKAFFSRPGPSILIILTVSTTMVGIGYQLDAAGGDTGFGDSRRALRAGMLIVLFLIASMTVLRDLRRWRMAGRGVQIMAIYALYAMISATYSVGPFISLWKGFEVLVMVMVAISVAGQLRERTDIAWLWSVVNLIIIYLVMTVFTGLLLYPAEAWRSADVDSIAYIAVRGLVPVINPATQGALAALTLMSVLAAMLTRERMHRRDLLGLGIIMAITVTLIILAHSRTQIFATMFAVVLLLLTTRRVALSILLGVAVTMVGAFFYEDLMSYIYRGQTEEQFTSFTGRIDHWENVMQSVIEAPVFGRGFYATQRLLYGSGSVDNTYLESLVGLGFVGLLLLLYPILYAARLLYKTRPRGSVFSTKDTLWLQVAAVLVVLVSRAFTSPTFASMHVMLLFYLLAHISAQAMFRVWKTDYAKTASAVQTARNSQSLNPPQNAGVQEGGNRLPGKKPVASTEKNRNARVRRWLQ